MIHEKIKPFSHKARHLLSHPKIYAWIQHLLMSTFFQYIVLFFIFGSIGAIIYSSFESAKPYMLLLYGFIYISSIVFLIEYGFRLLVAPLSYPDQRALRGRLRYLFSFYGLVDFVAILPFILIYSYWGTDKVQIIVLPYIFIIFKLIRYSRSFQIIGSVLYRVKDELITAYTACGITVCFSGILMYYIEAKAQPEAFDNIGDGLWWAIMTFTTVGYGDVYPVTPLGRLLGGFISLIGIAMIALPTGIIGSAFMTILKERGKS